MSYTRPGDGAVFLNVRLQPRAGANRIVGLYGDQIKIQVTAPPVSGQANQKCLELLSDVLGVPASALNIVSGQLTRQKVIKVTGLSEAEVRNRIGL